MCVSKKAPKAPTSFSAVTSANVEVSLQNLIAVSFNASDRLV